MSALSQTPDGRRVRRWPRILALQLLVWPLAFVVGELGLRGMLALRGTPYTTEATLETLTSLQKQNRDFVPRPNSDLPWNPAESERAERVLHPYVGFDIVGGLELLDDQIRQIQAAPTGEKHFRIALFGGSVAQMFGDLGVPTLRKMLEADPRFAGMQIDFLSFARGGFRQPQLQAFLAYLFSLGIAPNAVICLDGFNEVAIGKQNAVLGTHVSFPSVPHWAQLVARGTDSPKAITVAANVRSLQKELDAFTAWALESGVEKSAITGKLALLHAARLRRRCQAGFIEYTQLLRSPQLRRALAGPVLATDGADPVAAAVALWRESSRNMRALCEARGIAYFHVLQPTLHDEGAKPMDSHEVRNGRIDADWLVGVRTGYPAMRAAGKELAAEGEHFFDASRVFEKVSAPLYDDACHFNSEGNVLLAEALGPEFLKALP